MVDEPSATAPNDETPSAALALGPPEEPSTGNKPGKEIPGPKDTPTVIQDRKEVPDAKELFKGKEVEKEKEVQGTEGPQRYRIYKVSI